MLALLDNVHQLVVAVALDGRLKGPHMAVKAGAFDVGDDFVHNAEKLGLGGCCGKDLDRDTCFHGVYLQK